MGTFHAEGRVKNYPYISKINFVCDSQEKDALMSKDITHIDLGSSFTPTKRKIVSKEVRPLFDKFRVIIEI